MPFSPANPRFCLDCRKARKACVCALLPRFMAPLATHFWVHVAEDTRSRSTSWLAHRMVQSSVYTVVHERDGYPEAAAGKLALLFPGECSQSWDRVAFDGVLIVDGTWDECRSMVAHSPFLQGLPQITFREDYQGINTVRRPPQQGTLCTAEALGRLYAEMGYSDGARLIDMVHMLNQRENRYLQKAKTAEATEPC